MDYADAVATFCGPRPAGTQLPEVVRGGGPARRLRDACEPLAMHAVWNRRTNERLAALGLDFLTGYVGGRAASLGEPSPPVVAAAFAWFEPNLLAGWYEGRPVDGAAGTAAGGQGHRHRRQPGRGARRGRSDRGGRPARRRRGGRRRHRASAVQRAARAWPAWRSLPAPVVGLRPGAGASRRLRTSPVGARGRGPSRPGRDERARTECWLGMPLLSYTATRGLVGGGAMRAAVDGLEARG